MRLLAVGLLMLALWTVWWLAPEKEADHASFIDKWPINVSASPVPPVFATSSVQ